MKFRRLISPRYNYNLHTIHPNIFKSKDLNFSSLFFSLENASRGIWLTRSRQTNTYGAKINSLFLIFLFTPYSQPRMGIGRDGTVPRVFVSCRSSRRLKMSGQVREILSRSRSSRRFPSKFRSNGTHGAPAFLSRNFGIFVLQHFCPQHFCH